MCVPLCVCVLVSDNGFSNEGVTAVADALEVNITVQEIDLSSEWCW